MAEYDENGDVISARGSWSLPVPYGRIDHAVRTFEWSRTEPDVMVGKLFAPGLGIVLEYTLAGGNETLELVRVNEPAT